MKKTLTEILGTGIYLPSQLVTSDQLEENLGYLPGTIAKSSGVVKRYIAKNETSSEMGANAASKALEAAKVNNDEIDAIVFVGGVPQQAIPSTAALIHHHLGLKKAAAFDINATCLSFLKGFFCMANLIEKGIYKKVLLVAADIASVGLNPDDPKTASLFGDGAAAVILGASEEKGIISYHFETESKFNDACYCKGGGTLYGLSNNIQKKDKYFYMNGPRLVKAALRPLLEMIKKLELKSNVDIDLYIPHQASPLALALLMKKMKVPSSKFMNIVRDYGNLIATSLPFALHKAIVEGRLNRGNKAMLFGTAAGLSIGGLVLEY